MTKHLVYVYGTLKAGYWNSGLLAKAKFLGAAITVSDGFTMYDGGFPYVVPDGLNRIKGEVYEVDDNVLANLDRLEGVPHHYIRKEVDVVINNDNPIIPGLEDVQSCNMYVAAPKVSERLKGSRERVSPDELNICEWRA